ncbi:MAG: DUF4258 domain-containing protein [Acidobacteria bacterium]|nr:DUF4258 domain-containing protein [Acidobacteriota bacterium]
MNAQQELLAKIKRLAEANKYRIRLHAVRHMIEEGFSEENIIETLRGASKILEDYNDELRCLVFGYFELGERTRSPLHVVCDYSSGEAIDIITAYIPQKPWWLSPTRRGRSL